MNELYTLAELGWRPVLQQQISLTELEAGYPARVNSVFRNRIQVTSVYGEHSIDLNSVLRSDQPELRPTTGDWIWLEKNTQLPLRLLQRINVLQRTAAGSESSTQIIASNIDIIFIVSSCNQDFNPSRIERYLSMCIASHIPAVIVLTKSDLCENSYEYVDNAQLIHRDTPVIKVNALSTDVNETFKFWLNTGDTIGFIGSSGVGKSTLTNALLGHETQNTNSIREDDGKGRHTTTDRQMFRLKKGAWVMDTPGMRELHLIDDTSGIDTLFSDIDTLQSQCRFSNCRHETDQGCAVQTAIDNGKLDERRWRNYLKLKRESLRVKQARHEQHAKNRDFSKKVRHTLKEKKKLFG